MKTCLGSRGKGMAFELGSRRLHLCVWGLRQTLSSKPSLPELIRTELPTERGTAKIVLMAFRNAVEDMGLPVDEVHICFEDHGKDGGK